MNGVAATTTTCAMASATPRTAPPNGRPRTIASGSAMTRSPTTTPTSTPSQMRRSAPRTPAPRRSASRARPMLNNPVVTNVTVAEVATSTTHAVAVPPDAARSTHKPATAASPGPSATSAMRSSSRSVLWAVPRTKASPRRIPPGCMAKTMAGSSRSLTRGGPNGSSQPIRATAIAIDRKQRAMCVRIAARCPACEDDARQRGASEGEHREGRLGCSREALDQDVRQRDPGGLQQRSREQRGDALRRRVRAHRQSANRDQVDSRHSARRASAHGRSTRRPPVRTRRR